MQQVHDIRHHREKRRLAALLALVAVAAPTLVAACAGGDAGPADARDVPVGLVDGRAAPDEVAPLDAAGAAVVEKRETFHGKRRPGAVATEAFEL